MPYSILKCENYPFSFECIYFIPLQECTVIPLIYTLFIDI